MKKISIFAVISMFCITCFGAAAVRSSSVPLVYKPGATAQKTGGTTVSTVSDSGQATVASANNRIAISSPLKKRHQNTLSRQTPLRVVVLQLQKSQNCKKISPH